MTVKSTYVSVWDGGTEIRTSCQFDTIKNIVFDIEPVEDDGLDILEDEYIELPNGEIIRSFNTEDDEF